MSLEDYIVRSLNRRHRTRTPRETGLYLGQAESLLSGERTAYVLPLDPVQHVFVCGRSGKGKSTLFGRIMYEKLRRRLPFVNADFHSESTPELLAMIGEHDDPPPVVLFKPGVETTGWNPIQADRESLHAVVQELISIFHLRLWPDAWGPRLEEVLRQTLLPLAEAGLTLLEVISFLSRPEFRRAVLRRVSQSDVLEFWSVRFERLSPAQRNTVIEPVLNKLSIFHDPALRYVVGQSDGGLHFETALAQGHSIFADFSSLRGHRFLFAALLFAKFKNAVYALGTTGSARNAILLDEFHEAVPATDLDDYLRAFRKFRVEVYLATQHLALAPELRSAIFGNCSVFISFATSAADAALLGREFGSSDGELAAELLPELKTGQAIVKVRGEPVRLLHVSPAPIKPTAALVAAGRGRCLNLGRSREEIDAEIAGRTRDLLTAKRRNTPHPEPEIENDHSDDSFPEGYD